MSSTKPGKVDLHLEVDIIPVPDIERFKQFYDRPGWTFDADDAARAGRPPPRCRSRVSPGSTVRSRSSVSFLLHMGIPPL